MGAVHAVDANRLTYLDTSEPFGVGVHFPKLTTPQWVGEPGVEAVVTLGIDDMSQTAKYEAFLRPILNRLQQIDGRSSLSIFCNAVTPEDPQLPRWLQEGVSLEVHTLSHPCPLLAKRDFTAAEKTFHGGVDLLNHVPGNVPVAFRTPCCDSINSPSPRVYAELFDRTNAAGQFLRMDSSVVMLMTTNDPALPTSLVREADGRGRFTKYVPFPSFVTTVENYPYPWIIGRTCWEFACMAPSDWEAQNILGSTNATMLADWRAGLDAVVLKQGNFNFVFHPHGWSASAQLVEFIDDAARRYGSRVKFLNYPEALDRLTRNLSAGQALRAADGSDNGVRLLDLDGDGFLDVLVGNRALHRTRLWVPATRTWVEADFPADLVDTHAAGPGESGVRFGILEAEGRAMCLVRNEHTAGAWRFAGRAWEEAPEFLRGLELDGQPIFTRRNGADRGVRLRDVDGDGVCELLVSNDTQNAIFRWNAAARTWERVAVGLPPEVSIVTAKGEDNGLRFADVNGDGHDDILFSNETRFALWLYVPEPFLGWGRGWTRKIQAGVRARPVGAVATMAPTPLEEIPPIVRAGPQRNNGAWIHSQHLWVQNEDTAELPNLVDRRSFDDLLRGVPTAPQSPAEALASFRVRPGFHVELVASEPMVQDPVAFDWGADGRLWVVELHDYPLGVDGHGKAGGIIKFLEDTDGDGTYDRATEFLREVNFPNAILPWRRGVLISAAPEILYAEDTDGDGRADVRRVLFSGFNPGNPQHRANGFALGLDGWIYGANGDSGGDIRSEITGRRVSIQGRDFRFRPDSGEFEAIEGQTQYGRNRDDWGHWFGNANYTWLWQYPLPSRYLARNPHLAVRDTRLMLARYADSGRVFPASRALPRPNVVGEENRVTSACSALPYRDDLFGPEFATSVFISEPSENLIHREVVEEVGSGLASRRAAGEERSEFLASTDNWFRPVQLKTGPDGALYVADMYRQIIEHPEWIPADTQARVDVRAGEDRGRIYRVVPDGVPRRRGMRLAGLGTRELVAALESSNGWQRDTVQRLLQERGDAAAVPALRSLATRSANPKVRVQAAAALNLLGGTELAGVVAGLRDPHPAVRIQALQFSEAFLRPGAVAGELSAAMLALTNEAPGGVLLQLALSLGEWRDPRAGAALLAIARRQPEDALLLNAVFSSAAGQVSAMLAAAGTDTPPAAVLERLIQLAAAQGDDAALQQAVAATVRLDPTRAAATQFSALAGLLEALERRGTLRTAVIDWPAFAPVMARAEAAVFEVGLEETTRLAALRVLGRAPNSGPVSLSRLAEQLAPQHSLRWQQAVLAALQRQRGPEVADELVAAWPRLSPALRGVALEVLLTQPVWRERLLDAVAAGRLSRSEVNLSARQKLREQSDPVLAARAAGLFGVVKGDRSGVIAAYAEVHQRVGDSERGRAVFQAQCTPCHRLQGEGHDVGPDLGAVVDKSVDALLTAILDPNQAIEERYLAYLAVTRAGREISGIVASETPNSLTLRSPNGTEDVLLRSELTSLVGTRRSLMPEGFEHALDVGGMADLIAYLTATGPRPKEFSGNRPELLHADPRGDWRLLAGTAEIYGDSLVYEAGHHNLGFWQSANDRAVWTLEVARAGVFEVSMEWACPEADGHNRLGLETAEARLEIPIGRTGTWDDYRDQAVGRITLPAGRQRLVVRGVPPLRGAILDLRQLRLVPVGADK